MSFVHLHAHTEYSMLDGASRIGDMFAAAAAAGMPACAITDHGVMYGALEFYKSGSANGVKPILGMEGYLFAGDRREKPPQKEHSDRVFHLTLLAANDTGYSNLVKISSKAWLEGFHYWPRTDHELLAEYSEGLICLSGCLSAEIPKAIVAGDLAGARRKVAQYREMFGDRFYLELQDHGIAVQQPLNDELVKIGREMGIGWVATNDSHYTHKKDAAAHEVLLCINTGSELSDPNRFKFDSEEFYLKTPEEMAAKFARWPGACETTLDIAERCNVNIELGKLLLPRFEVPAGKTLDGHLSDLVLEGARRRYGGTLPPEVVERAEYELRVIKEMKFAGYFLVVQDFVNWAKQRGIRVGPGRGSAAGSIVSYSLGITDLDPLRYDLMFERFLNPERIEMPDIDIDFDERKRGEVIRYVSDKYGADHVAQIVTYGTIKGKQAIKDAARVLGFPYQDGDKLTKMYPALVMGRDAGLEKALETSPELKQAYEGGGAAKEIIDVALGIENLKRSAGIHAAGVVIGRDPLVEHVPLKRGDHDEIVTQFDMKGVTDLGLLKMDFLGLRNLTVIDLTLDYIKANRNEEVDVDNLEFDDEAVYKMLQRGDSDGVFQLESDGMRRLLAQLKPERFEHIMALIALYRPGPMDEIPKYVERKNDPAKIEYLHPALEDLTRETYGVLVYQEQIVLMLQKLAGYTPGKADKVRKAIGKKNRELMAAEEPVFIEGCRTKAGMTEGQARELWRLIQPFADYSFNRAHSACYAYIAYQTAWLKAHYPVEYMAALLTSVKDRKDDKPKYLGMARKMRIEVLLPDVNESDQDFTPVGDTIRFGLSAIRGIGESVVEKIIEARGSKGRFTSFHDFCRKVDFMCLNRKTVEALSWAGAFESLNHTRKGLIDRGDQISAEIQSQRKQQDAGQFGFWDIEGAGPADQHDQPLPLDEFNRDVLNAKEKEMLGVYVSDHPLIGLEGLLARMTTCSIAGLAERTPGETATIGGLVTGLTRRVTKAGGVMLQLAVEDLAGAAVEVLVFTKVYETYGSVISNDSILLLEGRVDRDVRDDSVKMIAMKVSKPDLGADRPLIINLPVESCTEPVVDSLKEVLTGHPGSTQVFLHLAGNKTTVLRLDSRFSVDTTNGLHAELKALLGPSALTSA
ncbi:MAG: DNA polymerase III subunit alpha [Actinomycetota bacterium]